MCAIDRALNLPVATPLSYFRIIAYDDPRRQSLSPSMDVSRFEALRQPHNDAGAKLFAACNAELFPCDVVAFSILDRSLNLIRGFELLVAHGAYSSAIGLLRMQLDNSIRFHGIVLAPDPHAVAYQVLQGKRLSQINGADGKPMTDHRLLKLLLADNPQLQQMYELASGYIHLSKEHVSLFLSRSPARADGTRDFVIGDDEDHIPVDHKSALLENFLGLSRSVPKLVVIWGQQRSGFGTNEELKRRFDRLG